MTESNKENETGCNKKKSGEIYGKTKKVNKPSTGILYVYIWYT